MLEMLHLKPVKNIYKRMGRVEIEIQMSSMDSTP